MGLSLADENRGLPISAIHPPFSLTLRLLGGFALLRDGRPCEPAYEKGRMLLAYLAAEPGRGRPRKILAALFWPGLPDEAALANLRQVLHDLRHALKADGVAPPFLHTDRDIVRLDPGAGLEIDVAEFSAPAAACPALRVPAHCRACLGQMETRAARYRGEFMAGCAPPGSGDLDAWLQVQREELHLRALALLNRLADCHERFGDHSQALSSALRFRQLEPWNEAGLRRVMRLLAQDGRRAAALAAYDACRASLNEEFGMPPDTDTQALAEHIRRGEPLPTARAPAGTLPPAAEERRQVTVLRCDVMPIDTGNMGDLDESLARLREPRASCAEIIRAHGGYLMPAQGGGLLAYFGFPDADEHAARHAVQAALVATRAAGAGIDVRAGIHSGVVIGGGDPQVPDIVGAATDLAARLSQLAEPGTVAVSAATQRLVAGYFDCTNLGACGLPGDARAQEIFRIDRANGARDRLEAAAAQTPMVGRRDETVALRALWQDARRGAPQVVLLRGEAGIGKSRLLLALKEGVREGVVREFRCFPEHSQSPFHPLATLLDDAPDTAPPLSREQALAAMLDRLYAADEGRPLLLLAEDLHWADPSTLEFLALLAAQPRTSPLLAVFTARPEFQPAWDEKRIRTQSVDALDAAATADLIAAVAPGIAPDAACRIAARADGVPLFAEEMARDAASGTAVIPATLHDLLAARLDRLGEAKRTAQLAAALGREFDLDLLRKLAPDAPAILARNLDILREAGLVCGQDGGTLQFRHALIQEAAYQSQTKAGRRGTHRRIAQTLQDDFPAIAAAQPELLARHFAAAGGARSAIDYWVKAGQRAALMSANTEAIGHFHAGLQLLATLPADQDRVLTEYKILVSLSPAVQAAKGHGSLESTQVNARLSALSSQVGDCPEAFLARWALEFNALSSIGFRERPPAVVQLLQMAHDDPVRQMAAHAFGAVTFCWLGKFKSAQAHAECMLALDPPNQRQRIWEQFGVDLAAFGTAYVAYAHYFLGFPDQAQRVCERMLEQARAIDHPHTLAQAIAFALLLYRWLNKPVQAQALSAEGIAISRQHGFSLWLATGEMAHGWALAMQGKRAGIAAIKTGDAGMKAAVPEMSVLTLAPLAEAYIHLKQFDAALGPLAQAQADEARNGGVFFSAELHRLKGEALLGLDEANAAQAEAAFRKALAISREQQAKALELRAAMSLARLWKNQAKHDKARRLLTPVFGWFTEGFDTPDLQDARKLLDSLAR